MRKIAILPIVLVALLMGFAGEHKVHHIAEDKLQEGDVILRTGFGAVSFMAKHADGEWSHVGLLHKKQGTWFVIHAHPKDDEHEQDGVQEESLKVFLSESDAISVVRIAKNIEEGVEATRKAESLIGTPFNASFEHGSKSLYCSELVAGVFPNEYFPTRRAHIPGVGDVDLIPPKAFYENQSIVIKKEE